VSVRLILDTSALCAYVAADMRSIEVGELIASVEENGDVSGIPVLCLLAAFKQVKADGRTRLLELAAQDDGPALVLPFLAPDVAHVGELAQHLSDDQAQAVVEAQRHDTIIATFHRGVYATALDSDDILDL